jgi:peptidyl-prolyl cis-trans isomerase D
MLQSFRNFFKSKVGIAVTLVFLGLIALAFASADITGSNQFGGVAGGDRAAIVGKDKIGTGELSKAASRTLEQIRREQPMATMPAFLKQGGLDMVLDDLIDRRAVYGFGESHGFLIGKRLVDSEISENEAFKGPDGKFSNDLFRQFVQQKGMDERAIREEIGQQLMVRQVLAPVWVGTAAPAELVLRNAALRKETRIGSVVMLPSAAFAPQAAPSEAQIAAYYAAHRDEYTRPERRVIRFATFGEEALGTLPAPTDAQIAARYKRDADKYAASETRSFTQLVAPTKAAAEAIRAEAAKGKSLGSVASSKGLATTSLAGMTRAKLTADASKAVADAAFATARGSISAPVQGGLGWYLLQVDGVTASPGKSLAQARGEIAAALTAEQRRAAIADLGARIEEQIDGGASMNDIAAQLKVRLLQTKPVLSDGRVYLSENESAPPVLSRVLSTAFTMEEEEPQVAEVEPGKTFLIYEASEITAAAPAPLKDIRDRVTAEAILAEGDKGAKLAAERIVAQLRKGVPLEKALAAEKRPLPAPQRVSMNRDQLAAMGGKVPPALGLFFSMAEGTAKRLEGPANAGWYVVKLDDIVPGKVTVGDPVLAQAKQELGQLAGNEYEAQFRAAVRTEVGVERNKNAVDAVRRRLLGEN